MKDVSFPSLYTIERCMCHDDEYKFRFKGKLCRIWLDMRGNFHSYVNGSLAYTAQELRDVVDGLYRKIMY